MPIPVVFGRKLVESTFTLAAPPTAGSNAGSQPTWFRDRFVADAEQRWLQFLESVEPARLCEFSPIVIYGPPHSGKSLLASIIADKVTPQRRGERGSLLTVRSKELDRRIRHAFVVDDLPGLLELWEAPQTLWWEDAHDTSGNAAVDGVLCELLERRTALHKLTIVCSRTAPWDTPGLSPRLASRLAGGWVVKLDVPSQPLLAAVVQAFETHSGIRLDEAVRHWLVSTPRLSVPGLFRWLQLTRCKAAASPTLSKRDFLATADQAIDPPSVECSAAMRIVARELAVDLAGLTSPSRRQSLVRARGIAIVVLRDLFQLTWQEVASWAGRKDHSTVIHAYQKTTSQLATDRELEQDLARVVRQIYKQQPLAAQDGSGAARRRSRAVATSPALPRRRKQSEA